MFRHDALRLLFNGGLLLAVGCGGRSGNDAVSNSAPLGGAASYSTSQTGQGGIHIEPSMDSNESNGGTASVLTALPTGGTASVLTALPTGGTASVLTASPLGGSASIGGAGESIGGAVIVSVGGTCAVMYAGTVYSSLVSPTLCGNGLLEYTNGEQCDDGNKIPGDGCSSDCRIEPYWNCPPCGRCVVTVVCGDGIVGPGEVCDDGNTENGDGCSSTCRDQEPGYLCRPGRRCIAMATCGNGALDPGEECDGDASIFQDDADAGCAGGCTYQGYCGDGEVRGDEQCDEGPDNDAGGCGGCTDACRFGPYCGDGRMNAECGEICDDGINAGGYDSCAPGCRARGPYCGDGVVQVAYGEECDVGDQNGALGSPCSSYCMPYIAPLL